MNSSVSTANSSVRYPNRWLSYLGTVCRIIVALVFISAAILKSFDPDGFAFQIESYGIISGSLAQIAAIVFIVVEIVLAVGLLINFKPKITIIGTAGLLFLFIGVTAWAWSQGKTEGCGCFGSLASRTPAEVIIEDLLLLAGLLIAWMFKQSYETGWKKWAMTLATLIAVILLFLGPYIPVDSFVTDLKVGADLRELSVSDLDVDVSQGEYLVALLGEDCPECEKLAEDLGQFGSSGPAPEIVGIFVGNREQSFQFFWKYGATFTLGNAPREEVGRFYRKLPRMFLLKDGIVTEVLEEVPQM